MPTLSPISRTLFVVALILGAMWIYTSTRPLYQPDGVVAPDAPVVQALVDAPTALERNAHRMTATARFSGKVRLLSVQRYARDRAAQVSPVDVGVGWGRLSDSAVLRSLDLAQGSRELVYQIYDPSVPDTEMQASVLNLHLVPSTAELEARMKELRAGQVVSLSGFVVEVTGPDGWRWQGEPAEPVRSVPNRVLWVVQLEIMPPPEPTPPPGSTPASK